MDENQLTKIKVSGRTRTKKQSQKHSEGETQAAFAEKRRRIRKLSRLVQDQLLMKGIDYSLQITLNFISNIFQIRLFLSNTVEIKVNKYKLKASKSSLNYSTKFDIDLRYEIFLKKNQRIHKTSQKCVLMAKIMVVLVHVEHLYSTISIRLVSTHDSSCPSTSLSTSRPDNTGSRNISKPFIPFFSPLCPPATPCTPLPMAMFQNTQEI